MSWFPRVPVLFLLGALLTACATPSHRIELTAEPALSPADVGGDRSLNLLVRDLRPQAEFGRPRQAADGESVIYTEQDVAGVVAAALDRGLQAKGFRPRQTAELDRRGVQVDLKVLQRQLEGSQFVAEALLELVAVNESGRPGRRFEAQYRARQSEWRPLDGPLVSERVINGALNRALNQLLEDEKLLDFLAR